MNEAKDALERAKERDVSNSFPVRNDPVGRFLDGYDYILNNPPGFAVATTIEWAKEHRAINL